MKMIKFVSGNGSNQYRADLLIAIEIRRRKLIRQRLTTQVWVVTAIVGEVARTASTVECGEFETLEQAEKSFSEVES